MVVAIDNNKETCLNTDNSVLKTIGHTPLVELLQLQNNQGNHFFAKLEMFNPTLSIKDRIAKYMVEQAESKGLIQPGAMLVECSSGNTGASLAFIARQKGYQCVICTTEKASKEKVQFIRSFGATVHVCPIDAKEGEPDHYIQVAKTICETTKPSYFLNQYGSQDNVMAHYSSTGPEIWNQTKGNIDILVACASSGGTISGVGRYLKQQNPEIKIILVDPVGSVYYDYFHQGAINRSHIKPYQIEGAGKNKILPTMDFTVIDDVYQISDQEAFAGCHTLSHNEGISGGGTSGACYFILHQLAKRIENKSVVAIFPDSGIKYLSKI
jgi:cystathionine beta-synthase